MSSPNDDSYPIQRFLPQGLNPGPGYRLPKLHEYRPQPQTPVIQSLPEKFYINTSLPNPFTVYPIQTEWTSNELILLDPRLRVVSGVSPLDIAHKQSSNYISPY